MREISWVSLTRLEPALADSIVVVVNSPAGHGRVLACSAGAKSAGLQIGMATHEARGVAPDVTIRIRDEAAVAGARNALFEVAAHFSPRVEPEGDRVYLDLAGCVFTESAFADAVQQHAARVGLPVQVGIASGRNVARIAALQPNGPWIIADDTHVARTFLAPLPIEQLNISSRVRTELYRLGIRTMGLLAAMSPTLIGTRLGADVARLVPLCCGQDTALLSPRAQAQYFEEAMHLEWEVTRVDELVFVFKRMIDALTARVLGRLLVVSSVEIELRLVSKEHNLRDIALACPGRDVAPLLDLARISFEKSPPTSAVVGMRVLARTAVPRVTQVGLFDPVEPSADELGRVLARLSVTVGDDRIGVPLPQENHRPHAMAILPMSPLPVTVGHPSERSGTLSGHWPCLLALHVLRPRWSIEVIVRDSRPTAVVFNHVQRAIVACGGPFRLHGGWWEGEPFAHDGYDIELDDSTLWLLAWDRLTGRWWFEGVYE